MVPMVLSLMIPLINRFALISTYKPSLPIIYALKIGNSENYQQVWQTASLYHLVHSAALLASPITKNPTVVCICSYLIQFCFFQQFISICNFAIFFFNIILAYY